MKQKLLSILLCICICLSFLTGCSLVTTDDSYKDSEVVMTVGTTDITREELVDQYYSFYNQYYQYFMYYDNETMMDLFYTSVVSRAIILEQANAWLSDGTLKFVDDEYEEIWYDVYDFINRNIDSREKALLLQSGVEEDELPERLAGEDEDQTAYKYEAYEFEEVEKIDYTTKTSATELDFTTKYNELKNTAIYTYNAEKDDEKPRQDTAIPDDEKITRTAAWNGYVQSLIISAKAEGKSADKETVLKAEVQRLYKSYYESALYLKYQEYVESTVIDTMDEHKNLLDDEAIVKKYIELTNKDNQANSTEQAYIDVVTSTSTESLILYHYQGEFVYFTVQHILVQFDDATVEELKLHEGYTASVDSIYRNEYEQIRAELAGELNLMQTSYRDENGYIVTETKQENGEDVEVSKKVTVNEIINDYNTQLAQTAGGLRDKTLLFNKLAWKYSDDTGSLNTKFATKLGMSVSSETDNHGSFVSDFADGARALYENYKNGTAVGDEISKVLSDYGLHLMMLTGVYAPGKIVETTEDDGSGNMVYRDTADIVAELKENYVSNLTEQSLYEYFYDLIKDTLVGNSGTFFTEFRNKLTAEYQDDDKIKYINKLSYDELSTAIGH